MSQEIEQSSGNEQIGSNLPPVLRTRLDMIILSVKRFWEERRIYNHFTNHGPAHSERVYRFVAQLAQELPETKRLNPDETFLISAAAWLYETGLQNPILEPELDFRYRPNTLITPEQLNAIREKRPQLTRKLIYDSVSARPASRISLGLGEHDQYTILIAEICGWTSNEPLNRAPETEVVNGIVVRVRLLVALLRLADQLYIDSGRVQLEQLKAARLPERQFARWWAYHYTQALPISNGQIRFNYFLPSSQKDYIGHIRALIEPDFEFEKNHVIHYLWENYRLRLMPSPRPNISRFDRAAGFQQLMDNDLIVFLRHEVKPITTILEEEQEEPKERCLLLLDYENFLLQIGQEGYFFTADEISRHVTRFLSQAQIEHDGTIDAYAFGHWKRADLLEPAKLLHNRMYDLETLAAEVDSDQQMNQKLAEAYQGNNPPKRLILVAPPQELNRTVKSLVVKEFQVSTWISSVPDADTYRGGIGQKWKSLSNILNLDPVTLPYQGELEIKSMACLLALQRDFAKTRFATGMSPEQIRAMLEADDRFNDQVDWWQLWLMAKKLLILTRGAQDRYILNQEHPLVTRIHEMSDQVIDLLQEMDPDCEGLSEELVLRELKTRYGFNFRHDKNTRVFLGLLKDEEILRRKTSWEPNEEVFWHLNPLADRVVKAKAPIYQARFAIVFDQVAVGEGRRELYKHTLKNKILPYLPEQIFEIVYQLAVEHGLIRERETEEELRHGNGRLTLLLLDETCIDVAKALRNRNLILTHLLNKVGSSGISHDTLYERLKQQTQFFTVPHDEFGWWIQLFAAGQLVQIQGGDGQSMICLNTSRLITQNIFARMYLPGLVRAFRRMGASRPERAKPIGELLRVINQHVCNQNRSLTEWTFNYAEKLKVVITENRQTDQGMAEVSFLNWHPYIHALDNREIPIVRELTKMIKGLNRRSDGWVPKGVVLSQMDQQLRFGYNRTEQDYWLDQAIFRHHLVEEDRRREPGRPEQLYLRAKEG